MRVGSWAGRNPRRLLATRHGKMTGGVPSCRWRASDFSPGRAGESGRKRLLVLFLPFPPGTEVPGSPSSADSSRRLADCKSRRQFSHRSGSSPPIPPSLQAPTPFGAEAPAQDTSPKTQDLQRLARWPRQFARMFPVRSIRSRSRLPAPPASKTEGAPDEEVARTATNAQRYTSSSRRGRRRPWEHWAHTPVIMNRCPLARNWYSRATASRMRSSSSHWNSNSL